MNKNLEKRLREYKHEYNLNIDGRNIPYALVTAFDYLLAKNENWTKNQVYDFKKNNYEIYKKLNQIIALKQSCVLLRNTSYSCQSLPDDLFELKLELIHELREKYNYEFDEDLYENFPSV